MRIWIFLTHLLLIPMTALSLTGEPLRPGKYVLRGLVCADSLGGSSQAPNYGAEHITTLRLEGRSDHGPFSVHSQYQGTHGQPCDVLFRGQFMARGSKLILDPLPSSIHQRSEGRANECHQIPWESTSKFDFISGDQGTTLTLITKSMGEICGGRLAKLQFQRTH